MSRSNRSERHHVNTTTKTQISYHNLLAFRVNTGHSATPNVNHPASIVVFMWHPSSSSHSLWVLMARSGQVCLKSAALQNAMFKAFCGFSAALCGFCVRLLESLCFQQSSSFTEMLDLIYSLWSFLIHVCKQELSYFSFLPVSIYYYYCSCFSFACFNCSDHFLWNCQ